MDIQNEHAAVGIFALYAYFSGCIQGVEGKIFPLKFQLED